MLSNQMVFKIILSFITIISILGAICSSTDFNENHYTNNNSKVNIVVVAFPGATSHHFMLRQLLTYVIGKNPNTYNFYVIAHTVDKPSWDSIGLQELTMLYYGDITSYLTVFETALESSRHEPIFGYNDFNKAMIFLYRQLLGETDILKQLKQIKIEIIITDISNYISNLLRSELEIKKSIYVSPICIYSLQLGSLEYNTSIIPILGTDFSEDMGFIQRVMNHIGYRITRLLFYIYAFQHVNVIKEYGYKLPLEREKHFMDDSIVLTQCTAGVHYSTPLPLNYVSLGSVLASKAQPLDPHKFKGLLDFIDKYEQVIYCSQGTIVKVFDLQQINTIFEAFPEIGFILSFKQEIIDKNGLIFSENVMHMDWIPQNDLLGIEKIKLFITHGGINSMLEGLYHAKPLIVIGITMDQVNNAGIINYRKLGRAITSSSKNHPSYIIELIRNVLNNNEYKENCIKVSKIMQEKNGLEIFDYWLKYTNILGYEHLLIKGITSYSYFEKYNIDVFFLFFICLFIFYKLMSIPVKYFFCRIFKFVKNESKATEAKVKQI